MTDNDDMLRVYSDINEYCVTYNIPRDNLLDILEDQKVLPMIRGKATEYISAAFLRKSLNPREWDVQKLNLNAQPGSVDEDVSLTYRRTGMRFKVEAKNAVRGSFKAGTKKRPYPHFTVKCHKSRSNLSKQETTNDRYLIGDFDLLVCNVSNSIFRSKALEAGLTLIKDKGSIDILQDFYRVKTDPELRRAAYDDWRMCLPSSIVQDDGSIPRTPPIMLVEDPYWFKADVLAEKLRTLIKADRERGKI